MSIEEIDVEDLAVQMEQGAVVVDVREPAELAEVRVPGVLPIPLGQLVARAGEIPAEGTVYIICRTGARSARACEQLNAMGRRAVNVAGGTVAWINSGRATESGA